MIPKSWAIATAVCFFVLGYIAGSTSRTAQAQTRYTVGCTAKGGQLVAGVCIDRRVILR